MKRHGLLLCGLLSVLLTHATWAAPEAAIASAHPLATAAGKSIIDQGGNAFDAAVAVAAALAVVEPSGSGLGGGGFFLLHEEKTGRNVMLDGREKAPLAAHRTLYQDENGTLIPRASIDGALAAAIPGIPAALVYLAEHYGVLPLSQSLQPAITYAREGFVVDGKLRGMMRFRAGVLKAFPETRSFLWGKNDGLPAVGERLRQPDLAHTLDRLAQQGRRGFYQGEVAQRLLHTVRQHGGIWQQQDLDSYRVVARQPVVATVMGMKVISASLPSSGGTVLVETLRMLEAGNWIKQAPGPALHLRIEAMKRAYRDRADYLGDSDVVSIPGYLLDKGYARGLARGISVRHALRAVDYVAADKVAPGGEDTTHFSIMDTAGNRVAATLSINYPFGSALWVPGVGVFLNDEMDDFSSKPGVPNVYGLVGGEANAIAPGKRPLSSMTPTFLEAGDRVAVLGTPGGSRIISMVLQAALGFLRGDSAQAMVAARRVHHQFLPDVVQYEPDALSADQKRFLQQRGHHLQPMTRHYGNMQLVLADRNKKSLEAASDPRGIGDAIVWKP